MSMLTYLPAFGIIIFTAEWLVTGKVRKPWPLWQPLDTKYWAKLVGLIMASVVLSSLFAFGIYLSLTSESTTP